MAYAITESFVPRSANKDENGKSYELEWILISDTPMTPEQVLNIPEIPTIKTVNPRDTSSYLTSVRIDPRQSTDRNKWTIVLSYRTGDGTNNEEDPTNWRPVISFETYTYQQDVTYAYHPIDDTIGNPTVRMQNSASDPFIPAYTQPRAGDVIVITRNERKYDLKTKRLYKNTMNDEDITIAGVDIPAYRAWMRDIHGQRKVDYSGNIYFNVRYEIALDFDSIRGWVVPIIDRGFYMLYDSDADTKLDSRRRILEQDVDPSLITGSPEGKRPVSVAQKLDGNGALMPMQYDAINDKFYTSTFIHQFWTYFPTSWVGLGLPEQEDS